MPCSDRCKALIDRRLLITVPRQRRDGSSTSDRYRILIAGGDNLSPPRDAGDTRSSQGCRGHPDMPVILGTANRIVIDPPQPMANDEQRIDSADVEGGGGFCSKLEYPKGLPPS